MIFLHKQNLFSVQPSQLTAIITDRDTMFPNELGTASCAPQGHFSAFPGVSLSEAEPNRRGLVDSHCRSAADAMFASCALRHN